MTLLFFFFLPVQISGLRERKRVSGDHPCVVIERTARVKRKGSGRMAKGDRVTVSAHLKNVVKIEKLVVLTEKKKYYF